jgi:hypothetical protein
MELGSAGRTAALPRMQERHGLRSRAGRRLDLVPASASGEPPSTGLLLREGAATRLDAPTAELGPTRVVDSRRESVTEACGGQPTAAARGRAICLPYAPSQSRSSSTRLPLVTAAYPLGRIAEAFETAAAKPDGFATAVLEPT